MKKCPECAMQYQDSENYCMECGKKLIKLELAEMPPAELMSLISHVKDMEKEIICLKESAVQPEEILKITQMYSEEMKKLKDELSGFRKMQSSIPTDEIMSLVTEVGELGSSVEDLEEEIEELKNPEMPDDITDIKRNREELGKLRDEINGLRSTIRKDVADVAVSVLKGVRGEVFQEVQKFKAVIEGVEQRTNGEIKSVMEELEALVAAQKGLEASVVTPKPRPAEDVSEKVNEMLSKKSEEFRNVVLSIGKRTSGELDGIREQIGAISKAQERMELDRVMPDETIERKIDDMIGRRMEEVKVNVTREIVREIRKMLER